VVLGAAAVELAATRAGVRWRGVASEQPERAAAAAASTARPPRGRPRRPVADAPVPVREGVAPEHRAPGRDALHWLGIGAGIALVALANTVLVAMVTGWGRVAAGVPALGSLGFALVRAAAVGVREELLYRGVVLHAAARAGVSPKIALVFASLTGAAAMALLPGAQLSNVALAAVLGLAAATAWQESGTAWAAVGLHTAWSFGTGIGLRGGVLDVSWSSGGLGEGVKAAGVPAVIAALALLITTELFRRIAARARAAPAEDEADTPPDSGP
jgi:uncharacterized protein